MAEVMLRKYDRIQKTFEAADGLLFVLHMLGFRINRNGFHNRCIRSFHDIRIQIRCRHARFIERFWVFAVG